MTRNLSVVIATHNRKEILLKVLEAYKRQTAADRILEILVVDDGSTDGTGDTLQREFGQQLPLRHIWQECHGQASARNRGINESHGEIILFTDDDIIPSPTLVAEHLAWHQEYPAPSDAILGYVAWSPDMNPTPFMEWLAHDGVLFGYGRMRPGQLKAPHLYSCNLSLKRDFLLQNGIFDEDFKSYGFEDSELGHRLAQKGLRIFYNPEAVGYHYKKMSVADVWRRAELVETARPLYLAKVGTAQATGPVHQASPIQELRWRIIRGFLRAIAPAFQLFDTHIPMPWVVYRAYYFHYILPKVRTKLGIATQ